MLLIQNPPVPVVVVERLVTWMMVDSGVHSIPVSLSKMCEPRSTPPRAVQTQGKLTLPNEVVAGRLCSLLPTLVGVLEGVCLHTQGAFHRQVVPKQASSENCACTKVPWTQRAIVLQGVEYEALRWG